MRVLSRKTYPSSVMVLSLCRTIEFCLLSSSDFRPTVKTRMMAKTAANTDSNRHPQHIISHSFRPLKKQKQKILYYQMDLHEIE